MHRKYDIRSCLNNPLAAGLSQEFAEIAAVAPLAVSTASMSRANVRDSYMTDDYSSLVRKYESL